MPLVGRSAAMQEIYRVLARLMQTDLTLMITGESGTGKELVARALHDYGKRRNGPFVAINMAAIPRDLIESELFGHEKGAFTGAQALDRPLRAGRKRYPVPRRDRRHADGCPDAAAARAAAGRIHHRRRPHADQDRCPDRRGHQQGPAILINQGLFREDLYYRLNVVPLRLPALRDRAEDVPDLVRHFVRHAVGEGLDAKRFDGEALELLKAYPWPGNVRELENVVRRVMALYPQDVITREIIDNELRIESPEPTSPQGSTSMGPATIAQSVEENMRRYFAGFGEDLPPSGLYQRVLEEVEYPLILAALTATRGNQIKAADLLGLNRNTLRKKIRELGVTVYRSPRPV
jgi:two-component system nitrogen regulation response regulator GlnG